MLNNKMANEFLKSLESNKKSPNTIANYKNNLRVFFKMMQQIKPEIKSFNTIFDFNEVTVDDINNMKVILEEELDRKRTYINNIVATVSSFYTYLRKMYEDECLVKNVGKMAGQMVEHKSESQNVFLELEETKVLLSTAEKVTINKKTKSKIGRGVVDNSIRNELIINLFLNCGLRGSELSNLEFKNVIEKDNYIRFFGKGKKERGLYVNDHTMELYHEWLRERSDMLKKQRAKEGHEDKIFLSKKRQAITVRQINRILEEYCTLAGIEKHITSHKLRHTVATMFLKEGKLSLQEVADILGHSSVETTKRYSHITDDNKKLTRFSNPIFS